MMPLAAFFAVTLLPATYAPSTWPAEGRPIALERMLWGTWHGGDCGGDLTLKRNGQFERRHFGPANQSLSGTWAVRWDALPPTLILTCTDADWAGEIGTRQEVKVIQLDGTVLSYLRAGSDQPARYQRVEPKK
jgi:hypothetical protein